MVRVVSACVARWGTVLLAALCVCCNAKSVSENEGAHSGGDAGASGVEGVGGGDFTEAGSAGTHHGAVGGAGGSAAGAGGSAAGTPNTAGTGTNPGIERFAVGESDVRAVEVDDRYVFWLAGDALRRAPRAGGDAVTLATGSALGNLVVASGHVYFVDHEGDTVSRMDREGGGLETRDVGPRLGSLAVHGVHVYWTDGGTTVGSQSDGRVLRRAFDAEGITVLASGLSQPSGIAVDDQFAYFGSTARHCSASSEGDSGCFGGGISRVPREGGTPASVDDEGTPGSVVIGESTLHWLVDFPVRVKFAKLGEGEVGTLTELQGETAGPFVVDDAALYLGSNARGRVVKVPFDGTPPLPLALDLGEIADIAVDPDWLYVAAPHEGRILRIKKDGSAAEPGGPITGPCPAPVGTVEGIVATPREDGNLEQVALLLDEGEVTAREETYERVTTDVARMRALVPRLADIDHFPRHDGRTLRLIVSDTVLGVMMSGDYTAWNCLNDFYGVRSLSFNDFALSYASVELKGNYRLDVLARLYAELPGVEAVEPNSIGGDGPTICAWREGDVYEYVVDRADGDCPAGCITHDAHLFRSSAGAVELIESWNSERVAERPEWFERVCRR